MARGVAKAKEKTTLWSLITRSVSLLTWGVIWVFVSVTFVERLEDIGLRSTPGGIQTPLMILAFLLAWPATAFLSYVFTSVREWAEEVEISWPL